MNKVLLGKLCSSDIQQYQLSHQNVQLMLHQSVPHQIVKSQNASALKILRNKFQGIVNCLRKTAPVCQMA